MSAFFDLLRRAVSAVADLLTVAPPPGAEALSAPPLVHQLL